MQELLICLIFLYTLILAGAILFAIYLFGYHSITGEFAMYPLSPTKVRVLKVIEAELLKPDVWKIGFNILEHKTKPVCINLLTYRDITLQIPINKKLVNSCINKLSRYQEDKFKEEMLK